MKALQEFTIPELSPEAFQQRLEWFAHNASGRALVVLDVRQPEELAISSLAERLLEANAKARTGAIVFLPIPLMELAAREAELAEYQQSQSEVVVVCRVGERSKMAARFLRQIGFTDVSNLSGGIRAFARQVDSSLAVY